MPSIYDTLAAIVKDTIANDIAKIQSETLDALGCKHYEIKIKDKEIDNLNYKFDEIKKRENVLVKLIRDERVKVKLLEKKIELISQGTMEMYDANIMEEVKKMIDIETGIEESENQANVIDELKAMGIQSNVHNITDELNIENETYEDNDYGKHRQESDEEDLLENIATSSDTDEDNDITEENVDDGQIEYSSEPANSLDISNDSFAQQVSVESSHNPEEKSHSFNADVDIEDMINTASILISEIEGKSSYKKSESISKSKEEDEYINKLLEDEEEIEETIESFEHSFDELAEIEEGCEFEQPVEEEKLSKAIEKHIGRKRKRKLTEKYADAIMDLKESTNTSITSSKRMKTSKNKMDESFDSSFTNKRRKSKKSCGSCTGCLTPECEVCRNCLDKPKFGGKNKIRQKCVERTCNNII